MGPKSLTIRNREFSNVEIISINRDGSLNLYCDTVETHADVDLEIEEIESLIDFLIENYR